MAGGTREAGIVVASSDDNDCRNGDIANGRLGYGVEYGQDLGKGEGLATSVVLGLRNAWQGQWR